MSSITLFSTNIQSVKSFFLFLFFFFYLVTPPRSYPLSCDTSKCPLNAQKCVKDVATKTCKCALSLWVLVLSYKLKVIVNLLRPSCKFQSSDKCEQSQCPITGQLCKLQTSGVCACQNVACSQQTFVNCQHSKCPTSGQQCVKVVATKSCKCAAGLAPHDQLLDEDKTSGSNTAAIVGGVLATVAVIGVAVVAGLLYVRHHRQQAAPVDAELQQSSATTAAPHNDDESTRRSRRKSSGSRSRSRSHSGSRRRRRRSRSSSNRSAL